MVQKRSADRINESNTYQALEPARCGTLKWNMALARALRRTIAAQRFRVDPDVILDAQSVVDTRLAIGFVAYV